MVILHLDSTGNGWRFNVPDCTRPQAAAFARCLRDISRIDVNPRRRPGRKRTPTEQANAQFCAGMEQAILETLAARFPANESDYNQNELFVL